MLKAVALHVDGSASFYVAHLCDSFLLIGVIEIAVYYYYYYYYYYFCIIIHKLVYKFVLSHTKILFW